MSDTAALATTDAEVNRQAEKARKLQEAVAAGRSWGAAVSPSERPERTPEERARLRVVAREKMANRAVARLELLGRLYEIAMDDEQPAAVVVAATEKALDRLEGRPQQKMTLAGDPDNPLLPLQAFDPSELTVEQRDALREIANALIARRAERTIEDKTERG